MKIITGKLKLEIIEVDDHYSMMQHLQKQICKKWKISKQEFFEMVKQYVRETELKT